MFVTAFPLLAATLTGDPFLIAGVTIASRLPWLMFSMLTGAMADRMDRRRLMVGADLARFVIVAALGVAIAMDVEHIWMLYSCAFALGTLETLHTNAAQALLVSIVEKRDLMEANARFGSAQVAAVQFAGPPLGASLFSVAASIPFLADAASFAGSAALIAALADDHGVEAPTTRLRDDVREGFLFVLGHPALRRLAAILAVINFFYFSSIALLVLYTDQILHSGKITYTALFIGAATGTVASRWFVSRLTERFGVVRTIAVSFWMWATAMVGLAITSSPVVAVAMFGVLGVGTGFWLVLNTTVRQELTPGRLLGRMNAAYRTISWGVVPFGAGFGGLFARAFGLRAPFIVAGVALALVAALAMPLLKPIAAAVDPSSR